MTQTTALLTRPVTATRTALALLLAVLVLLIPHPAEAQRGGPPAHAGPPGGGGPPGHAGPPGGGGSGGNNNQPPEPEPEPVEPTGVTHVIYLIGTTFFPDEVHAQLGDTLMFVNMTSRNQKIEADDGSWSSGTLYNRNTYPIMLDDDTDWSFTGETRTSYGWNTYVTRYSGQALPTPNDDQTDPAVYPYIATSLAERYGVTEAERRIETTRQHVYTVDTNGNVLNGGPGG